MAVKTKTTTPKDTEPFTLRLPSDFKEELRLYSVRHKEALNQILLRWIRREWDLHHKKKPSKR